MNTHRHSESCASSKWSQGCPDGKIRFPSICHWQTIQLRRHWCEKVICNAYIPVTRPSPRANHLPIMALQPSESSCAYTSTPYPSHYSGNNGWSYTPVSVYAYDVRFMSPASNNECFFMPLAASPAELFGYHDAAYATASTASPPLTPPDSGAVDTHSPEQSAPFETRLPSAQAVTKKRSRTAHACEKCRIRKAKVSGTAGLRAHFQCSGGKTCTRCVSKNLYCVYSPASPPRPSGKPKSAANAAPLRDMWHALPAHVHQPFVMRGDVKNKRTPNDLGLDLYGAKGQFSAPGRTDPIRLGVVERFS